MASPWGEGFFCRAIFKKLGFSHQLSQSAKSDSRAQPLPRGSEQRSWTRGLAKPDRRGNIQGDGWRLRRSGHAEFSLPRGTHAANFSAFQFHQLDFYVTHRFFVTFFPEESNVPLVPSFPRSPVPSFPDPRLLTPSRTARPRTCRACAPWSGRSARPRRPRWSAHSGWDQNPSPWP